MSLVWSATVCTPPPCVTTRLYCMLNANIDVWLCDMRFLCLMHAVLETCACACAAIGHGRYLFALRQVAGPSGAASVRVSSGGPHASFITINKPWGGKIQINHPKNPENPGPCPPLPPEPTELQHSQYHLAYGGRRGVYFDQEGTSYLPAWQLLRSLFRKHNFLKWGGPKGRSPNLVGRRTAAWQEGNSCGD